MTCHGIIEWLMPISYWLLSADIHWFIIEFFMIITWFPIDNPLIFKWYTHWFMSDFLWNLLWFFIDYLYWYLSDKFVII